MIIEQHLQQVQIMQIIHRRRYYNKTFPIRQQLKQFIHPKRGVRAVQQPLLLAIISMILYRFNLAQQLYGER